MSDTIGRISVPNAAASAAFPLRTEFPHGCARKRVYRWYATPWEILRQLPDVASHLKAEVTIATLDQQAQAKSDTQAAEEMQAAKRKLFGSFQGSMSQAAMRLPLVGRGETAALRQSKTKTFLEGKPAQLGGAESLPLVGPGTQKSKQERRP
jgi:hypothetical protein